MRTKSPSFKPRSHAAASTNAMPPSTATSTVASSTVPRAPGDYRFEVGVDGLARHWKLVVPATPAPSTGRPLLVLLHGLGSNGEEMRAFGFEAHAAPAGVMVAYPDAVEGSWNDGRTGVDSVAHQRQIDDVGFVAAVIEAVVQLLVFPTAADKGSWRCGLQHQQ